MLKGEINSATVQCLKDNIESPDAEYLLSTLYMTGKGVLIMNMPTELALGMQQELVTYSYRKDDGKTFLSDYTGGDFISFIFSLYDPMESWQIGLDLYYRLLLCDLVTIYWADIDMTLTVEEQKNNNRLKSLEHIKFLAKCDPKSTRDYSEQHIWETALFVASDLLVSIIDKHNMEGEDSDFYSLHPPFINEIEKIFNDNDVPWSFEPLILIQPNYPHEGKLLKTYGHL